MVGLSMRTGEYSPNLALAVHLAKEGFDREEYPRIQEILFVICDQKLQKLVFIYGIILQELNVPYRFTN